MKKEEDDNLRMDEEKGREKMKEKTDEVEWKKDDSGRRKTPKEGALS